MVLLLALVLTGAVSLDAIAYDYALSEKELRESYNNSDSTTSTAASMKQDMDKMRISKDFWACLPDFVPIVKGHLDSSYGGLENYLAAIGVGPDQLESIKTELLA